MKKKISLLLIWFIIFSISFPPISKYNSISIILLCLFSIYYSLKYKIKIIFNSNYLVLPILYFALIFFSILYSSNTYLGIKNIEKILSFLVFPLIFTQIQRLFTKQAIWSIYFAFLLSMAVVLVICYANALINYTVDPLPLVKGNTYFTSVLNIHPNYLSIYLIFSASLILYFYKIKKLSNTSDYLHCSIKIILIFLIIFSIVILRTRSGIFALIFTFLVYTIHHIQQKKQFNFKKTWLLGSIFYLIIFILIVTKTNPINNIDKFLKRDTPNSINQRLNIWHASLEALSKSPLLGYGIGDRQESLNKFYYITGFEQGIANNYNAHNQFLQIMLTAGILPSLILLLMLFNILKLYFQTKKFYLLGFLVAVFVTMGTECVLERQQGIVFFVFFYSLFYLESYQSEKI